MLTTVRSTTAGIKRRARRCPRCRRDRHGGRGLADKSLATFVGGKAFLTTPSRGSSAHSEPSPATPPRPTRRARLGQKSDDFRRWESVLNYPLASSCAHSATSSAPPPRPPRRARLGQKSDDFRRWESVLNCPLAGSCAH